MSMLSTRGAAAVSESMAILRGLAPDGGLYVPKDFPHFSMEEIAALGALDYQARALAILQKFLPDFTADELKAIQDDYERIYAAVACLLSGEAARAMECCNG